MKYAASLFPRALLAMHRRLRRSRPGSVLILCVALLVLLALIGTAMISTSRTDRYSSVQHTYNTEVDLLVEGVKSMAQAAIVNDLWDTNPTPQRYRPANSEGQASQSSYDHWDMPAVNGLDSPPNDNWLASRYPQRIDQFNPYNAATNPFVWRTISAPLASPTPTVGKGLVFDSPYVNATLGIGAQSSQRTFLVPGPCTINYGNGSISIYPGLHATVAGSPTVLAADADGDGIADSGLVKLPVGTINGVTYYAGVRIVDNNSAINVNSAWSRLFDFNNTYNLVTASNTSITGMFDDPSGGSIGGVPGFYQSNVGLLELLRTFQPVTYQTSGPMAAVSGAAGTSTEMASLNLYRFGGSQGTATQASQTPAQETVTVNGGTATVSYVFSYANQSDALEHGLTERMDNPDMNVSTAPIQMYTAFSLSDQAALAAHFCVVNPDASPSTLESKLPFSLAAQKSPYVPGSATNGELQWFQSNFEWDQPNTAAPAPPLHLPLRSMLVTRNPVSNIIPVVTNPIPANGGGSGVITPLSISISGTPPIPDRALPGMSYSSPSVALANGTTNFVLAPKTDINKAPFSELWRAYWSVMVDVPQIASGTVETFQPPHYDPPSLSATTDGRMFRSPCRNLPRDGSTADAFSSSMVLQLRSALAAVNAMDLRDADDVGTIIGGRNAIIPGNITSREIPIYNTSSGVTAAPANLLYTARVYGTEKQPFVTEVYASSYVGADPSSASSGNSNPGGYIAIELHNPYPVDMVLDHWAIGTIARPGTGWNTNTSPPANLTITPLESGVTPIMPASEPPSTALPNGYGPDFNFLGGGQVVIPANGYVVLENYPPGGVQQNPNDAMYRPAEANTGFNSALSVYVPYIERVFNKEFVLFRPHYGQTGTSSATLVFAGTTPLTAYTPPGPNPAPDQTNTYNEGSVAAPNLADMVPIDSFDFTGLTLSSGTAGTTWHYTRASAPTNEFRCVYPGLYIVGLLARQEGIVITSWADGGTFVPATNVALTQSDAAATYLNNFPAIQLSSQDWPSYQIGNSFPFGGFARNGDMLQVPFIGAYEIRQAAANAAASVYEINSLPMDCSFADDQYRNSNNQRAPAGPTDPEGLADDLVEQIGRFCPIRDRNNFIDDFDYNTNEAGYLTTASGTGAPTYFWLYHFGTRLFDYLTVQSPASDYKPNIDTSVATGPNVGHTSPVQNGTAATGNPYPPAGAASPAIANLTTKGEEVTQGVEGLININTAPWWVIASLPLLPNELLGPDTNNNGFPERVENLAKQIVFYRDGDGLNNMSIFYGQTHGPFHSIADLNGVVDQGNNLIFRDAIKYAKAGWDFSAGSAPPAITPYDARNIDGDLSPYPGGSDGVVNDFEEQNLMLNRISNLITTRSDSFTVYIIVQGWRNAGTATPQLVAQRRAAFIIDRSNVTGLSGAADPKITTVPTD